MIIFKKKHIFLISVLIMLCAFLVVYFSSVKQTVIPKEDFTIVIDAGHGGEDGGAVGKSGVSESYLNLEYAMTLKSLCEGVGFNVVMTRKDMNGLYSPLAANKKRSEMQKREKIINSSKIMYKTLASYNDMAFSLHQTT